MSFFFFFFFPGNMYIHTANRCDQSLRTDVNTRSEQDSMTPYLLGI